MTDRQVVRATWAMISLFALGAAGLALLAGWIIPLVAGPQFSTSIPLLRILAPAAACSAAYFFFAAFLFYARRTGTLSLVSATTAIIQTGLSFWLVQGWGSIGVAWATLAGAFIYACATGLAAHHVHPMPWFGGPHQDRD
jgi:O-antigen/teichoic acid export membrane protein